VSEICKVISAVSGPMSEMSVRQKIETLESEWSRLPQVEIPVVHRFSGGIYAREIIIPKETFLTGKIYKDDHFDVMVYGDITVTGDEGKKRLKGFNIFPGKRGKKRAGYAHSETKWITFCASPEMDDEDYIDHLTTTSFAGLEHSLSLQDVVPEEDIAKAFMQQGSSSSRDYRAFRLGYLTASGKPAKVDVDRHDFFIVLNEFGFTEEEVRKQSENADDYREVECSIAGVMASPIDGKGLFMKGTVSRNDIIMPARCGIYRTQAGRFTNHSKYPNAAMVQTGDDVNLVALMELHEGDEITIDYRCAINLQIAARTKQCQV
jgi:hypothetical protein